MGSGGLDGKGRRGLKRLLDQDFVEDVGSANVDKGADAETDNNGNDVSSGGLERRQDQQFEEDVSSKALSVWEVAEAHSQARFKRLMINDWP